jgi:hypothetical protein
MPERVTANRVAEFVAHLQELGGSSGNVRLREALGWDNEFYWKVQGKLVEDGRIVPGRGKGGSVRFTATESGQTVSADANTGRAHGSDNGKAGKHEELSESLANLRRRNTAERAFYQPIKETLEATWVQRYGFDEFRVEETHSQGSKQTGGTFTRPDLTVAGIRRYVFLPKRLEIITFEIKPPDSVGIMGVLEAIAHKEAAHRSYVIYVLSRTDFERAGEAERIIELAQKYGVGLIITENPGDVETWEILLDAIRHEPDPARLDRFLGDLPSEALKKQLHKWTT